MTAVKKILTKNIITVKFLNVTVQFFIWFLFKLKFLKIGKTLILALLIELLVLIDSPKMAWRSHGKTNIDLIQNLRGTTWLCHLKIFQYLLYFSANKIVRSELVESAMLSVDRGNYCRNNPYMDSPQGIGFGVTISAPHMHAHALELLKDKLISGDRALDVGSGSGYLTACMALMLGEGGYVSRNWSTCSL